MPLDLVWFGLVWFGSVLGISIWGMERGEETEGEEMVVNLLMEKMSGVDRCCSLGVLGVGP